jgi:hypothetical protein
MIRFLNDKTVAGIRYGKGSIANLDSAIESQLIATADAENYPLISRPIEILSSSAVPASCTLADVDEVLASYAVAAGELGVNSILQIEPLWVFSDSASGKTLKIRIGGATVYTTTQTTSIKAAPLFVLANRNSLSSQIKPYEGAYVTNASIIPETFTIDFSRDQTVEITGRRTNSGDSLALEYYRILHFIGD